MADREHAGNALRWRYTLALPVEGSVWHVAFDDWMYQIDARTVLNRSVMSTFGVELGLAALSFQK